MKSSKALGTLLILIVLLALVASGVGLFLQNGGSPFYFRSLHGQNVQMYGQGLYRYDTFFKAPILRGTDAVTLFGAIPLLILAIVLYYHGSLRGRVFLAGMLSYFLYYSASLCFGVAYNNLILVYILLFSASLFAFIATIVSVDLAALSSSIAPGLPRRGIAIFLFLAGCSVFVWLIDIVGFLFQGQFPAGIATYTTEATYPIDLGIIAPAAFFSGWALLHRVPLGYLLTPTLLTLNSLIGIVVVAQTIAQMLSGIRINPGQFVVYVGTFVVMSIVAVWLNIRMLKSIGNEPKG